MGVLRGATLGRSLIGVVALVTAVGPFIADWNETHIYNPQWPPHAKFHNAQTMGLGVGLAATTAALLARDHRGPAARYSDVDLASVTASLYWLTNITSLAFPGSKAVDPPRTGLFPQWKVAVPSLLLVVVGNVLERRPPAGPPDGMVRP